MSELVNVDVLVLVPNMSRFEQNAPYDANVTRLAEESDILAAKLAGGLPCLAICADQSITNKGSLSKLVGLPLLSSLRIDCFEKKNRIRAILRWSTSAWLQDLEYCITQY